jgi:hypothetical protein
MKTFISGMILVTVCAIVPALEPVRSTEFVQPGIEVFLSGAVDDLGLVGEWTAQLETPNRETTE